MTRLLVLGGSASGKSAYAVARASATAGDRVTFVATARGGEPELDLRIAAHRRERPMDWGVVEAGGDLARAIREVPDDHALLVDSLTLWVAGHLEAGAQPRDWWLPVDAAIAQRAAPVILVSDEVGSGVVPEHPSGRAFRDALGRTNRLVAATCDEVVLIIAGLPVWLKGHA